MKNLVLVGLIIIGLSSFAPREKKSRDIKDEVEWFIDTVKAGSNDFMNQFKVYVLYIYKNDSLQEGYCCGMSYMMNSYSYKHIDRPNYYFEVGEDVVFVCLYDGIKAEDIKELDLKWITRIDRVKIVQRLIPDVVGDVTAIIQGMACCFEKGKPTRIFYNNVGRVPFKGSIVNPDATFKKVDPLLE